MPHESALRLADGGHHRKTGLEEKGVCDPYLRWSSAEQSKGDSLRRQLEASELYCLENGLVLDQSLRDEGISAYDKSNLAGAFGTFLEAVRKGQIRIAALYDIEQRGKEMSVDERAALRNSEAAPLLESLHAWLKATRVTVSLKPSK